MLEANLSSSELAKLVSLPATTIKRLRCDKTANPTLASLIPIAKHFSISLSELLGEKIAISNEQRISANITCIPLLNWDDCTNYKKINQADYPEIKTEKSVSSKAFALLAGPELTISYIAENSILIIDPSVKPQANDLVIVSNTNSLRCSIKKFYLD